MRTFFQSTKFRIALALVASLILGGFLAALSENGTSPVSSALSFITSPVQKVAVGIADFTDNFNAVFTSSKKYQEKISEQQSEIADLKSQLVDYEKTKHKLEAYEEFLEVKDENPDFTFVPATVILRDTSEIYGTFTINKGTADGITVNSPVISGNSLVGVIKEISPNTSTVYTLFNPDISVSAYEIRTREDCYTEAEGSFSLEGLIRLSGLTKTTPVVSGGIVATSGIGGIYPKDLIIGTVKEIRTDEAGVASFALVTPDADYSLLTDVFIITDFEGRQG